MDSILRAPGEGENQLNVNDVMARAVDGVIDIMTLPYGVAVVGESVEATFSGKNALEVTWSTTSPFRTANQNQSLDAY